MGFADALASRRVDGARGNGSTSCATPVSTSSSAIPSTHPPTAVPAHGSFCAITADAHSIPSMRRTFVVTLAVGVIVALFGLIWALQGFGVLGGSPMSNTTTWSIIGPITVVIGIVIALFSWRKLSSK